MITTRNQLFKLPIFLALIIFLGIQYVQAEGNCLMCAEKTGGFNLVNYRHSSGVYHEQETEDLHRRI
ncbi:hypothetical protein ACI8B_550001 [Acinetobacter proteolyticus]|uniref:Uncharacterized protein n=1 Tax=Acinetobacter proteolyticus TaxID=1776741 RepID=A0A653KAW5_9GAMM|nr:hypothetical protein ACI8B_550001 [Acinetobacter proteolyticus]